MREDDFDAEQTPTGAIKALETLLRFIQLLCENHNPNLQNILRQQTVKNNTLNPLVGKRESSKEKHRFCDVPRKNDEPLPEDIQRLDLRAGLPTGRHAYRDDPRSLQGKSADPHSLDDHRQLKRVLERLF